MSKAMRLGVRSASATEDVRNGSAFVGTRLSTSLTSQSRRSRSGQVMIARPPSSRASAPASAIPGSRTACASQEEAHEGMHVHHPSRPALALENNATCEQADLAPKLH